MNDKYVPKRLNELEMDLNTLKIIETIIGIGKIRILLNGEGKSTVINLIIKDYYGDEDYKENIMEVNDLNENPMEYYKTMVKQFCENSSGIFKKRKTIIIKNLDTISSQNQLLIKSYMKEYSNINYLCSCEKPSKIMDNIKSHLFYIELGKINVRRIIEKIIEGENILIGEDEKEKIMGLERIKPALNMLEKYKLTDKVELFEINFDDYFEKLGSRNLKESIREILRIYDMGYSIIDILSYCFKYIKTLKNEELKYKIMKKIGEYISLYTNNENKIELIFFTNEIYKLHIG
uniref:Replication factor C C-terminal domain-containing protein n=1 Tax=viral metagenome TaxID=1070528 RepID=A0A6C0H5E9_9ZZZZ